MGPMQDPGSMGPMQGPRSMNPTQDPGSMGPMQDPGSMGLMQDPGPWAVWAYKLGPLAPFGAHLFIYFRVIGQILGPFIYLGPILFRAIWPYWPYSSRPDVLLLLIIFSISCQGAGPYSTGRIRLIGMRSNMQHRFVRVGFSEAEHVYMPGLVIAWHLCLNQHFWTALQQSSALLVKIQWPA